MVAALFMACASASHAEAPSGASPPSTLTLGIGGSDWSGNYGAQTNTNIAAALLTGLYRVGDLRLSASLPWMRISSDSSVFAGVDGTPLVVAPDTPPSKHVRQGLGDLTLGAAYLIETPSSWGVDVDTFARVKLPTSPGSTGLSTGETDYSVGFQVTKAIGRLAPFISIRYRGFDDTPSVPLKDGAATSIGASYVFPNRVTVVASYDYAERASRFIDDSHELSAGFTAPLPRSPLRLTGYAAAGLSSGAADVSGGLSLSLSL